MNIVTIDTVSLGNRGYLVHDGTVAVAIDIQRDYQRWIDAAHEAGVTITHVFETHMHNDYVTGGYQLAQKINAIYVIPEGSDTAFIARNIKDNELLTVGLLRITALHTPGHTEHHMSYRIQDSEQDAVFTGGGILYGTVGRSDLVSTTKTESLAAAQYDSAQRLLDELNDQTAVFPTHGFGSFCSSSAGTGASSSTMASERTHNIAFTSHDKAHFIDTIIAGLGPYPRYYAHMGGTNQAGPAETAAFHLHDYAVEDISHLLNVENTWVMDIRQRKLFAAHHPEGAVGFELGNSFATYAGWIIPWGDSMTLVGDNEADLKHAYIELSRIGMEQFVNGSTADLPTYQSAGKQHSYRTADFADLQHEMIHATPFVLDVRLDIDWQAAHITGAVSMPLHTLLDRIAELPLDQPIWVHCTSGYRASIAASLIDRSGRHPVLINDKFENAVSLNLAKAK